MGTEMSAVPLVRASIRAPVRVVIRAACAIRADADGRLDESAFVKERRAPKVGALTDKARMVLAAAARVLPEGTAREGGRPAGVSLGTLHGSMDAAALCLRAVRSEGFGSVTPSWYAAGLANATAAAIAAVLGLRGPNLTLLGHQAGLDAIIAACRQIAVGRAGAMLAGGFDLPCDAFAGQLAAAGLCPPGVRVEPGAGLLHLSAAAEGEPGAASVLAWSQSAAAGLDVPETVDRLMTAAGASGTPRVHVVRAGQAGRVDRLAAAAPILLAGEVLGRGAPGLHALVARGYGRQTAGLLIEKT